MPQAYHRGIPEEHGVRPGGSGCVDGCMPERVICLNFAAGYGAGSFDSVDRLCSVSSCAVIIVMQNQQDFVVDLWSNFMWLKH